MIPLHLKVLDADPRNAQDSHPGECGVCHNEPADCYCLEETAEPENVDESL